MKSKMVRYFIIPLLFVAFLFKINDAFSTLSNRHQVRIEIANDVEELSVYIRGPYQMIDPVTGKVLKEGRSRRRMGVTHGEQGLQVGRSVYPVRHIKFILKKDIAIYSKSVSRRYRGEVDFILNKNNKLIVINTLPIEQYVRGVLYHEVSHRWPLEAIKAQAVAVRSYALYQVGIHKDRSFDVTSDVYSQVYGGRSAERFRTNIAANRTKGQVLKYNGKIFPAYFHATCGGHTENVKELWKQDLKPLEGKPCDFCQLAPLYRWKKNYRSADIQKILNANSYNIGPIKEIKVIERNESGRIRKLQIIDRKGNLIILSGKRFRNIIGPNKIKSNAYKVEMKGYYFDLIGQGWGHGVGLCQWGAYHMSRNRFKHRDILDYYYPGTEIVILK